MASAAAINLEEEFNPTDKPAGPCAMVVFGAAGDLTKRKLIPALFNLAKDKLLPDNFAVVGVSVDDLSGDSFRQQVTQFVEQENHDSDSWRWFSERLYYERGDFADEATYTCLTERLSQVDSRYGTRGNYLFYLATAPKFFAQIVEQLGRHALAREESGHWRRVVIEKPFGHDLESAQALNAQIQAVLAEDQIYRIDHYLGKETVQNLLVFRFSNSIFEPLWNDRYVDHVQITNAEIVGVERRGGYFDNVGTMRDMVPNHVFQLLSLTAMEPPNSFAANAVRTEKDKVLEAVVPPAGEEAVANVVRGQYTAGIVRGHPVKAYREEEGVARASMTETYIAMQLGIDNWRWAGVPFFLRTGKSMTRRTTEIAIQFKRVPFAIFRNTPVEALTPNVLALQIQPDEGISLQFGAKKPGPEISLGRVRMDFRYRDYFHTEPSTGYETLVYDCMIGDATLFQRADSVEAGWAVVQPILDLWHRDNNVPLEFYPAGTAGPEAADRLLTRSRRKWRSIS